MAASSNQSADTSSEDPEAAEAPEAILWLLGSTTLSAFFLFFWPLIGPITRKENKLNEIRKIPLASKLQPAKMEENLIHKRKPIYGVRKLNTEAQVRS